MTVAYITFFEIATSSTVMLQLLHIFDICYYIKNKKIVNLTFIINYNHFYDYNITYVIFVRKLFYFLIII